MPFVGRSAQLTRNGMGRPSRAVVTLRNQSSSVSQFLGCSTAAFQHNRYPLPSTSPVGCSRAFSEASVTADSPLGLESMHDLPAKLLTAALPFIPTHGFCSSAILAGAACKPELRGLTISRWALSGLFPSTTTASIADTNSQLKREPIGSSKALAQRWIEEGNHQMKSIIRSENLTLQKDGIDGVKRAFEIRLAYNRTIPYNFLLKALALVVTPADPFWGVRLPIEPPHIIPYGSHAFNVAAAALAGLRDYSSSREWMLRRIRLAGVYSATELMALGDGQLQTPDLTELERLLNSSESLAANVGNTIDFIAYVNRSRQAIIKSLWLI